MTGTLCSCGAAGFHTCTAGERHRAGSGWLCPDCGADLPDAYCPYCQVFWFDLDDDGAA